MMEHEKGFVISDNGSEENFAPFDDLKRRVEITRDARFQANLRFERRNKSSYLVIASLSLFVIILSLVPNIFELTQAGTQALLALSIVNSVFIIITTFLEASGNFVHRGEQLHKSARKIATVFNKLMLLSPKEKIDKDKILSLQEEYQSALDDCPFNHDNIDYNLIKATKPILFGDRIYQGNWQWTFIYLRFIWYKFNEYKWLIPHSIVLIFTLVILYWIIFSSGLGPVELVGLLPGAPFQL
jgi:conflict system pore-forming effector with SLATT domain